MVSVIHFGGRDLEVPISEDVFGRFTVMLKTMLNRILHGYEKRDWDNIVKERRLDG